MKSINVKFIFVAIGLVFISVLIWIYLSNDDSRVPASLLDQKELPELSFIDDGERIFFEFPEDYNICDEGKNLLIVLEARNVAVLSETEPHIQIQVTNSCETQFRSPVFTRYFCDEGLDYEEDEGTLYKMINGLGFFPKEWSFKGMFVGDVEVSMNNQPFIEDYIFSCEEF